jgi:16S rRNA (guanine1516-N2)-methyltransferase
MSSAQIGLLDESSNPARAQELALELNLKLVHNPLEYGLLLVLTDERLELREVGTKTGAVYVDFVEGKAAHRRNARGAEGIARAVGLKSGRTPGVLDATAGLGRDAFVLASLGCMVTMCERNPVVWALLEDGLKRATVNAETAPIVAHMHLLRGNALEWLEKFEPSSLERQVVYLDPMYPPKVKTALPKKEMRLFHSLVGQDEDASQVLEKALSLRCVRAVVKRPMQAEPLLDRPHTRLEAKNVRWDIYLP